MQLSSNGAYLVCIASAVGLGVTFVLSKYSKQKKRDNAQEENLQRPEADNTSYTGWKNKFLNFSSFVWLASLTSLHGKSKDVAFHRNMLLQEDDEKNHDKHLIDQISQPCNADMIISTDQDDLCEEITDHAQSKSASDVSHTDIEDEIFDSKLTSSSSTSEWEKGLESSSTTMTSSSCVSENTVTFELISSLNESDQEETNGSISDDAVSYYHAASSLSFSTEQEKKLVERNEKDEGVLIGGCEASAAMKTLEEPFTVPIEEFYNHELTESQLTASDFNVVSTSVCSNLLESDITSSFNKDSEYHGDIDSCTITIREKYPVANQGLMMNENDRFRVVKEELTSKQLASQTPNEDLLSKDIYTNQSTNMQLSEEKTPSQNQITSPFEVKSHEDISRKHSNKEEKLERFEIVSPVSSAKSKSVDLEKVDISHQLTKSVSTADRESSQDIDTDLGAESAPSSVERSVSAKYNSETQALPTCNTGIKVKILGNITSSCKNEEKPNKSFSSTKNIEVEQCSNLAEVACDKSRDMLQTHDSLSCQTTKKRSAIGKPQTTDESTVTATRGTTKVDVHAVNTECCDKKSQGIAVIDGCTCDRTSRLLGNAPGSVAITSADTIVAGNTDAPNCVRTDSEITADENTQNAKLTSERITYNFAPCVTAEELYFRLSKSDFTDYDLSPEMGKAWLLQIVSEEQPEVGKQGSQLHEVHNSILQTVKNICTAVTQTTFLPELTDLSDLDYNRKEKIEKPSIDLSINAKKCSGFPSATIVTNEIGAKDQLKTDVSKHNDCSCPSNTYNTIDAEVDKSTASDPTKHIDPNKRETVTAKVQKDCVVFFGSRPGPGVPTICCMDVRMKVNPTDSCSKDINFVIEDCDTCDVTLHIKKLDGLVQEKTKKVYIKIILENVEAGFRRKKAKTKPTKLTNSVSFNADVVLQNIPRKMLTRGKLLVAVWSANAMESKKKICGLDIQLGKQMRFGDSNKDVKPLIDKLLAMKGTWLDSSLYLS